MGVEYFTEEDKRKDERIAYGIVELNGRRLALTDIKIKAKNADYEETTKTASNGTFYAFVPAEYKDNYILEVIHPSMEVENKKVRIKGHESPNWKVHKADYVGNWLGIKPELEDGSHYSPALHNHSLLPINASNNIDSVEVEWYKGLDQFQVNLGDNEKVNFNYEAKYYKDIALSIHDDKLRKTETFLTRPLSDPKINVESVSLVNTNPGKDTLEVGDKVVAEFALKNTGEREGTTILNFIVGGMKKLAPLVTVPGTEGKGKGRDTFYFTFTFNRAGSHELVTELSQFGNPKRKTHQTIEVVEKETDASIDLKQTSKNTISVSFKNNHKKRPGNKAFPSFMVNIPVIKKISIEGCDYVEKYNDRLQLIWYDKYWSEGIKPNEEVNLEAEINVPETMSIEARAVFKSGGEDIVSDVEQLSLEPADLSALDIIANTYTDDDKVSFDEYQKALKHYHNNEKLDELGRRITKKEMNEIEEHYRSREEI